MIKANKILAGTMMAASLLGGKLHAQNPSPSKEKVKTEIVKNKEFRDPGIVLERSGNALVLDVNQSKFSDKVKAQSAVLEKASFKYANEYTKGMTQDDPYNSQYPSVENLKFMRSQLKKINTDVTNSLFDLPLQQQKYEKVKGMLICLFDMLHSPAVQRGAMLKDADVTANISKYMQFAHDALRISIAYQIVKNEINQVNSIDMTMAQKTK